jgi:hypothetical protein
MLNNSIITGKTKTLREKIIHAAILSGSNSMNLQPFFERKKLHTVTVFCRPKALLLSKKKSTKKDDALLKIVQNFKI